MVNELFSTAVEIVRQYGLRCIDEQTHTVDDEKEGRINLLKDFTVDVKSSSRFYNVNTARELLEVYKSVADGDFITQHLHNGASFLIMSLGVEQYEKLCAHLAQALQLGFAFPENTKVVDSGVFLTIARANPWLVFCLLSRYAWFSQPTPQQGA